MKTNSTNPNEDLQAIREIMERSSKFFSLSGLAGVFAGICALAGAAAAWFFILGSGNIKLTGNLIGTSETTAQGTGFYLAADALIVLVSALVGAVFFSFRKARKTGHQFWTNSTRRLLFHLMLPLVSGGIIILVLIFRDKLDMVIPLMLVFYGLALVNAGKFTFGEIHYLGITQIALGIIAMIFIEHSLFFWAFGFGLMHIVYGTVMYYRHERTK
jgi:hypothetical protein